MSIGHCAYYTEYQTMLNRWIEPASDITFVSPATGLPYTVMSMEQVKKLRRARKLETTLTYRRAKHLREQSA